MRSDNEFVAEAEWRNLGLLSETMKQRNKQTGRGLSGVYFKPVALTVQLLDCAEQGN